MTGTQADDGTYERALYLSLPYRLGPCRQCGAQRCDLQTAHAIHVWIAVLAVGVLEATHPIILAQFRRLFRAVTHAA